MKFKGVESLFSREGIHDFLSRLALAFSQMYIVKIPSPEEYLINFLHEGKPASLSNHALAKLHGILLAPYRQINIIEMYATRGHLLEFTSDGEQCFLTAEEMANHIGMHLTKFPSEAVPDKWLHETYYPYNEAEARLLFCDSNKLQWVDTEEIRITDDLANKVRKFADSVLKNIPDECFEQFKIQNPELAINIERRKKAAGPAKLFFNWDRFSPQVQTAVLKHLFPKTYKEGMSLETLQKSYPLSKNIVYLVWLYANDFIWGEHGNEIDPRYELTFSLICKDGCFTKDYIELYRNYDIGANRVDLIF